MDNGQLLRAHAVAAWHDLDAATPTPANETATERLTRLAEHFDCAVGDDPALRGSNVEGVCHSEDGMIRLNPALSVRRKAFVLAHEIGHLLLGHPGRIADKHFQISETVSATDLEPGEMQTATGLDLPTRDAFALRGYSERDRWEIEANAFAAELLVPTPVLRPLLAAPGWTVGNLCERFGVGETLIRTQIAACLVPPFAAKGVVAAPDTGLDAAQEAAANASAPALVVAGPGSGKTRVLVERFARLVQGGVDPRRILALTFANKAASEMRERLAGLLVGSRHQAAIEVSTFHALGWQLLREYAHHFGWKTPLKLITPGDALLLMRPHLAALPLDGFSDLRRPLHKVGELLQMVSRCKDENQSPEAFAELAESWTDGDEADAKRARDGAVFYAAYQALLRENCFVDYGDLVTETLRLFTLPEVAADIRSRYDHLLVDEFQDINYASGLLVAALGGDKRNVWAVGDAKQSIYGFRGASPVNVAGFATAYPGAATIALPTNYRSLPPIVSAGQSVVVAGVPELTLSPHRTATDLPCVVVAETETLQSEAVYIGDEIERLLASGTKPDDIAVLCRSGSIAEPIAKHLSHRNIAHTWGGDLEERPAFKTMMASLFLATDDLRGLEHFTRLAESELTEAERRALLRAAPDFPGDNAAPSVRALLRAAIGELVPGIGTDTANKLRPVLRVAERLTANERPFTNLARYLFEEAAWFRALLALDADTLTARETLASVRQTLMLAARFAERQAIVGTTGETTTAFLEFVSGSLEAGGLGLPAELPHAGGNAVHLLTAHRAKGLQWNTVFAPGLAQGRFPARFQGHRDFPFPPGTIHAVNAEETPETAHEREEACLFYVAATRARDRLYLTRAKRYPANWQNKPAPVLCAVRDALRESGRLDEYDELPEEAREREARYAAPGMPSELLLTVLPDPVTQFALSVYDGCPRRYLYKFVYGLPENDAAYLSFHGAVMETKQRLLQAAQRGATVNADALFDSVWAEKGTPAAHWYAPFYAQVGREIVAPFAERVRTGDVSALRLGAGAVVSLPPPDTDGKTRQVRVTIDEGDANGVRRRRFGKPPKDGKKPPVEDKDVLYALHAEATLPPGATLSLTYPRYRTELPMTVTPITKRNRIAKMREQCDAIERGVFARAPQDDACPYCPYVLICCP